MLLTKKAMCKVRQSGSLLNVESKEADFDRVSGWHEMPHNTQHNARSCIHSDLQNTVIDLYPDWM